MYTTAFLLLLVAAGCRGADSLPLRVAWGSHNAPPYAITKDGNLVGGLIHDIGTRTATGLRTRAIFVNVPRARYESQLLDGSIDLTCIVNRNWLAHPDAFTWTRPLFDEVDVVVQQAGDPPWLRLSDLAGQRVGTILGYRYPTLDTLFNSAQAERDDAADLDSNLQRLALGRVDGVVDANIPVYYWLLRNDRKDLLRVAPLVVSTHTVSCAVSPRAGPGAARVRKVVDSLVRRGVVGDLLAAYLVRD